MKVLHRPENGRMEHYMNNEFNNEEPLTEEPGADAPDAENTEADMVSAGTSEPADDAEAVAAAGLSGEAAADDTETDADADLSENEAAIEPADNEAGDTSGDPGEGIGSYAESEAAGKSGKKGLFSPLSIAIIAVLACAVIALSAVIISKNNKISELEDGSSELTDSADVEVEEAEDEYTMDDYSTIEIAKADVEVSDDTVQSYIDSFASNYATTETVTEGTVEEGDYIYISYVGTIDGETFDGGSTEGTYITLGSSGYIDGFDDGLIGAEIGDTVELNLTFPDTYSNEDLAGQDVVFTVTIYSKEVSTVPDVTDEFVSEYSLEYFSEQCDTVEELETYIYDSLYESNLQNAILSAVGGMINITSRDSERYLALYEYATDEISYYATAYGLDADTLAAYWGYTDAAEYEDYMAKYYSDLIILFGKLSSDLGISFTEEEIDASLEEYMESNGFSSSYTLEEFKEVSGETWLMIYEGIELLYDPVLSALEDNVVLVDSEE